MIRFNCNGKPYIDPWHKFTVNDWDMPEGNRRVFINPNKPSTDIRIVGLLDDEGFRISPDQPINTSIFEEAEVVND